MSKPEDLPPMEYRFLGRSGLQVSAISLGGWLTYGGHVDREGTFKCMKAAYDCGVNFFDTAEVYADGESEKVMGEAIRRYGWKRNDLVISTKIYWGAAFGDNPVNNKGLSRKHIIEGMDASLERLGLSYVDLIYAHRPDRHTPMEETVRAFNHLINTGKALYWGTSEWNADEIAQAWRYADKLGLIGPVMEQPAYNMLERQKVEREFAHLYREVGLGLTVFSPMRQGILSGKYRNGIPENSRFAKKEEIDFIKNWWDRENAQKTFQEVVAKANAVAPIADKLGIKQSTLALAWVLKNPNVSSAIIGASGPEQVYENIRAIEAQKLLTDEIMQEIEEALQNQPEVVTPRF
ncbi:voltage-gated potassium channel beta-1 subunit [Sodiomyces alkalinus F11]|uniref:Voltage-gated potassium channel beta-1 subunit n=1 Tax=Sodiomyces alkalinus (strain CBS 110278 / VKM F-3762 / F11) TaxID=1314773 RepID=A0A3N2Q307_SODAK|nr:voltage-gated potassium channel beta-1 subunit [Sodiomyces alkalinus F11]ROT41122.1 voltage-gated potassium channel beta-1 subunit [Sodiomyces alkalinus F11]